MYVIFEGVDTSGKTTQIQRLCEENKNFISTKEPGNTPLGENLRKTILHGTNISKKAEFFLFLADRAEHYEKVIKPNIDKTILSDRGFISGMAYAFVNDESLDFEILLKLNRYALSNNLPEKIVFFQTNRELLKQRFKSKNIDLIEQRGFDYLLNVQESMKKIIKYIDIDTLFVQADENIDKITEKIKGFLK